MKNAKLLVVAMALTIAVSAFAGSSNVKVKVDTTKVLDIGAWAQKAKKLTEDWFPKIQKILGATNKDPKVTLAFERYDGIAGTAGDHIAFNVGWIEKHPDDFGMVIHELTHVVEAYPKYDPSWLIEGFADYIRYFIYEPEKKVIKINPARANYKNGYGDAAALVEYVERKHPGFIKQAHNVLRAGTYKDSDWITWTGKSLEENWAECLKEWEVKNAK
jgi:hypothetical protein